MEKAKTVYPYIPNSVESIKEEMLNTIGAKSLEELYAYIPDHLRYKEDLDIPGPILNEIELKKHIMNKLNKNTSTAEYTSFLGGGCARHYVPAICDEINARGEFLTAYCGEMYSDHGKVQAIFEFTSLMSELVDMDVVGLATYDGGQASSTAVRMTTRITGRNKIILPESMNPMIQDQMMNYCSFSEFAVVKMNQDTGTVDLSDLERLLDDSTACVFIENPSYLGPIETELQRISELAHEKGALLVTFIDPLALGIIEAPANMGADITCGENQGMGMHMGYGSGLSGFIAAHDKPEYIMNFPNHFYALYENEKGELGFQRSLNQRTSY
ncbi:MAG: PLP-dependent transferase, partial [Tissierellia bacterium]|nr:PLP-dependent transferase [Tissierellia bacterium]